MFAVEKLYKDVCFVYFKDNLFVGVCYDISIITDVDYGQLDLVIGDIVQNVSKEVYSFTNNFNYVNDEGVKHLTYPLGTVQGLQLYRLYEPQINTHYTDVFTEILLEYLTVTFSSQLRASYSDMRVRLTQNNKKVLLVNLKNDKATLQGRAVDSNNQLLHITGDKVFHDGGCIGEQFVYLDGMESITNRKDIVATLLNTVDNNI